MKGVVDVKPGEARDKEIAEQRQFTLSTPERCTRSIERKGNEVPNSHAKKPLSLTVVPSTQIISYILPAMGFEAESVRDT